MSNLSFDFRGQNFLVTGASSGMGNQVAKELALAGANVLAIARNQERLAGLKEVCPDRIFTASVDVCNKDLISQTAHDFVKDHGKFSGMVHAAGVSGITPLRLYDRNLAESIMNTSFWAGVDLLQLLSRKDCSENGASYVLFSSVASISNAKGMFAYNAAKAAVNNAVKTAAKELRRRQRVNCVLPGWVSSPMTEKLSESSDMTGIMAKELMGEGKPEDVSGLVLFLLSDRAGWITGAAFNVDGGFLA